MTSSFAARARGVVRSSRAGAFLVAAALLVLPARADAQTLVDLLGAIRQGGSWVDIPVVNGRGSLLTPRIPTAGMPLRGCMRIWPGHSGSWEIQVRDTQGTATLDRSALPDQPIPFGYETGPVAQLEARVQWSEPRDTTLVVWVGLRPPGMGPTGGRDPCQPVYARPG
jgi:hypothetical protein